MRLPGVLLAFVLGVLLASTTPFGTGAGTHQFDLLHPLFSHVHLVSGRLLTHEQLAQRSASQPHVAPGVALGSASGSNAADAGFGVSPTLASFSALFIARIAAYSVTPDEAIPPGRNEPPPDPPPVVFVTR